jgi:site-specific recombinase XerD
MVPCTDWRWLRHIKSRLRGMSSPARDDRARLVPAAIVTELVRDLLRRVETAEGLSEFRRALLCRDALMLAVLLVCPMRTKNMAAMAIGTTMQRRGTEWWISFSSAVMKNRRPYETPLPGIEALIEQYIDRYRPCLIARSATPTAGNALWISSTGKPLTAKQIGQLVSRRTERELGRDLNPHLFRKIMPTELAIHDPEHVRIAQPLLGHADYRTTERSYNLGRAIDAARRHHQVVHAIRAVNAAREQPVRAAGRGKASTKAQGPSRLPPRKSNEAEP